MPAGRGKIFENVYVFGYNEINMDSFYTYPRRSAMPLPNPMVILPSAVPVNEIHNKPVVKFHAQTFVYLLIVFIFVSVAVGILLWILSHEIDKSRTNISYRESNIFIQVK